MDQQQEFTPRPYQIELYEKSVAENSIIYLPTGSGKTYIAVLVIKRLSEPLHRPYTDKEGQRTVFIVNTVALAHQQSNFLARHTGLIVRGYSSDQQVRTLREPEWIEKIMSSQVMVMTAQIFLDLLERGIMLLSKVNLLIFDECHHATKDHPMRQIMKRFENCPTNQHPRVLGLSASLVNENVTVKNLETTLKELEITLQSRIITVETLSIVSDFSTKPKEHIEHYDNLKENRIACSVSSFIAAAISQINFLNFDSKYESNDSSRSVFKPKSITTKLIRIFSDVNEQLNELGLYGVQKSITLQIIKLDLKRNSYLSTITHVENNFPGFSDILKTHLMKIQKFISDNIQGAMSEEFLYNYASPKVAKLVKVLKNYHSMEKNKNKFCCIIFIERRFTAQVLYHILKELSLQDENFNFLRPNYILGQKNDPRRTAREQLCLSKWDKEVLLKFRNGTINCLIATSVIDEGIDIPLCTLVVRFYVPMDCRSYIQSKGRARHSTSNYVILVAREDDSFLQRYSEYQRTEEALQKALLGRSTRQAPTREEIGEKLYDYAIEPYVITRENGQKSVITEQNAISLINKYCSSLSSSKYTNAKPLWQLENNASPFQPLFRVLLSLPVMSPLKCTIKSNQHRSINIAKRDAACKACVELHKIGELDDDLSPKAKINVDEHANSLFPSNQDIAAIRNSNNEYQITYPKAWFGTYPQENVNLYLHVIQMIPINVESTGNVQNPAFYKIFLSESTYGILSTKKMPEIPTFPIFSNVVGSFQINVEINNIVSPLTECKINLLKQFHCLIFDEILKVSKGFTIFNIDNKENCFLVVPVSNDQIDWTTVKNHNHISTVPPSKLFEMKPADYEYSLVLPAYRKSSVYLVTKVCYNITSKSPFPIENYDSCAHYFKMRHNLVIENLDQPLLEVRPLLPEMNWLIPRDVKPRSDCQELLVPELCTIIDFPTVYWLKAVVLPSVVYRISQLLVAEDLRALINYEAGLTLTGSPMDKWEPLVVTKKCGEIDNSKDDITSGAYTSTSTISGIGSNIDSIIKINDLDPDPNKSLYTWTKEQEPLDLDRNADTLTPKDLDYFKIFVSQVNSVDKDIWKNRNKVKCSYCFSERRQEPPLQMLTKTNTRGPSPVDVMQSLTAAASNDIMNYERLETLGDAFLKYSVSLYLYQTFPNYGENLLTQLKSQIVSISNLFYRGQRKNLAGKLNIEIFSPSENFKVPAFTIDHILQEAFRNRKLPANVLHDIKIPQSEKFKGFMDKDTLNRVEGYLLSGINYEKNITVSKSFLGLQVVTEKCVADCVQAVIGTYLVHCGVEDALKVVKWFEILSKSTNIECLLNSAPQHPRRGTGFVTQFMPWAPIIEKRIGYIFCDRAFLLEAFTHQTFTSNRITDSYERLKFLGNAVLDVLLTVYIYETCGNLSPGKLTDLRSALMNNITFGCLSVRYGLHTALLADEPELFGAIDKFVQFQEDREYKVDDELLMVLLEEDDCNIAEYVDVPKALGDIFESVIGAIYLDSRKNLQVTWNVVYNLMKNEINAFSKNLPKQPIQVINEINKANPKFSPAQSVEGSNKVMVTLSIDIGKETKFFHGFGTSKKTAKCAASRQALKHLNKRI